MRGNYQYTGKRGGCISMLMGLIPIFLFILIVVLFALPLLEAIIL